MNVTRVGNVIYPDAFHVAPKQPYYMIVRDEFAARDYNTNPKAKVAVLIVVFFLGIGCFGHVSHSIRTQGNTAFAALY